MAMFNVFKFNLDYVSKFKACMIGSGLLMIAIVVLLFTKGLNYGVDFRGGAEIQVKFNQPTELSTLRAAFEEADIVTSSVQSIGEAAQNEFLIKVQTNDASLNKVTADIEALLTTKFGDANADILKTDIVGPKAGAQLRTSSLQAIVWSLLGIMIYLSLRFDFKYAPGAIAALFHDVLFVVGFFILTQREFSLQIVAAILAIIGYSVNDTVVIYDRVRELEIEMAGQPMNDIINRSINETMSRTILTSGTVFVVCVVMLFLGGGVIHDFFFALTVGVISGTYSTIYIASPITIYLDKFKAPVQKVA